ncbi:MAG TPA: hypothetical protein VGA88_00215 [Burkholderiales bacterium]
MILNFMSIVLWGFVATVFLTTLMAAGQGLGLSRMSIPFMLGTVFTADRDRAMVIGFAFHFINGWLFAFFYAVIFEDLGLTGWILGGGVGLMQGLTVLILLMPILPFLHPRMASEHRGPEPTRALEPPGFMALNYGRQTPAITLLAHVVYGAILGGCYRLMGP